MVKTKNYQNGKIYKIVDNGYNMCYIGSTINSLTTRMAHHRSNFRNNGVKNNKSFVIFEKYGIENCKIELIELYPCNSLIELRAREGYYQQNSECVNRQIAGRTPKIYYEENKETINAKRREEYNNPDTKTKIAEMGREYRDRNKEKLCERCREYYQEHKDEIIERVKQYTIENKDMVLENKRRYYATNKDRINEERRLYAKENRDEMIEKSRAYYESHKDRINEKRRERAEQTNARRRQLRLEKKQQSDADKPLEHSTESI